MKNKSLFFLAVAAIAFFIPYFLTLDEPQSYQGQLLEATDRLKGEPFEGSIVYLIKHNMTGAYGVIVNKATDEMQNGQIVFLGGPVVEDQRVILHTPDAMADRSLRLPEPNNDLAGSEEGAVDALLDMIAKGNAPRKFKLFKGYAGWAPGQLESELRRKHWTVAPYDEATVFQAVR